MASRGQVYRRSDRPGYYARFKHQGRFVHRGGFLTEEAAETWIHAERVRLEREELLGVPTIRSEVTVGRFFPKWKEWATGRWSPMTLASALTSVERVLLPSLRDRPLGRITPADLSEVLDDLESRRGFSGATRNRYISLLSSLFRLAIRRGLARENPALEVERGREQVRAMPYLGPDEEARLLAALPGWLCVPVLVALDAGLRAGEIGALTRRDLDLGRGVLTVRHSKNRRPRSIGLTRRLRSALEASLAALPRGQNRLFLRPTDGRPFTGQTYREDYIRAVDRAGLGAGPDGGRFRFHDLRHMAGVRLAEAGATPGEIKAFLGHKSLAATLRYIDHSPRDAALNAGRLLDRRLAAREPAHPQADHGGGPRADHTPQTMDDHTPGTPTPPVADHTPDPLTITATTRNRRPA